MKKTRVSLSAAIAEYDLRCGQPVGGGYPLFNVDCKHGRVFVWLWEDDQNEPFLFSVSEAA